MDRQAPPAPSAGPALPDETRYFNAPYLRPPVANCSVPIGLLTFPSAAAVEQAQIVAQVLRVFPEFRWVTAGSPDEPFEIGLLDASFVRGGPYHPENAEIPEFPVLLRCGDALTCARFAPLVSIATEQGYGRGCGSFDGLTEKAAWSAIPTATKRPTASAACARTRLCAAIVRGVSWSCSTFQAKDLTLCAAADECDGVVQCMDHLDAIGAKPGGPRVVPPPVPPFL